jgi:hypothetical protein
MLWLASGVGGPIVKLAASVLDPLTQLEQRFPAFGQEVLKRIERTRRRNHYGERYEVPPIEACRQQEVEYRNGANAEHGDPDRGEPTKCLARAINIDARLAKSSVS